jgi:hypothetical protein
MTQTHHPTCQRSDSLGPPYFACIASWITFHANCRFDNAHETGVHTKTEDGSSSFDWLRWGFHLRLLKISRNLGFRKGDSGTTIITLLIRSRTFNSIQGWRSHRSRQLLTCTLWWPASPIHVESQYKHIKPGFDGPFFFSLCFSTQSFLSYKRNGTMQQRRGLFLAWSRT